MFRKNSITIIVIMLMLFVSCSQEVSKVPITTNSEEAKELYLKGLSLADRLRSEEAVSYFEDALALDSNFAMAYIGIAFSRLNPTQLVPNLQKAIALKPIISRGEQLWIEASEAQVNNQTDEVRKLVREMLELYPQDERVHNYLATTYFQTQEFQKSIKYYLQALEINPKYSPVYNQLGYAYRFLQNYNEAEKMFQKYIELIPNDPNPYDSYGELLMQIGKFDESIRNYEKALSVSPYFTISYLGLASNLNYKEKHVEARNRLQKLLKSSKNNHQKRVAYNGIIISYIDEGNLTAAYKVTQKMRQIAIEESDTIAIANDYITLGSLLLEMGRYDEAAEQYNNTLLLLQKSNFPEQIKINGRQNILLNLAIVDLKQSNFTEAHKKADDFLAYASQQNNPNSIRLANQLYGMIALEEKKYESAIEYLRKSDQSNPYNIYRIALAYESLGDSERANSYFDKAAHANLVSNRNYSYIRKKALAKIQ